MREGTFSVRSVVAAFILSLVGAVATGETPAAQVTLGKASEGATISGRVADTEGRPVASARVSAYVGIQMPLRQATATRTETDETGRFHLVVPFPHVRYMLTIEKTGFRVRSGTGNVLVRDGTEIEAVAERVPGRTLRGVVMDGESAQPVEGAEVILVGEYGFRGEVQTDESGSFEIRDVPRYVGQGVLLARADGRVSPIRLLRGGERPVEVGVGPGAHLSGVVKEWESARPIARCRVTIRPRFASGFTLETTTAGDGRFGFADVPPGEYQVVVTSQEYFEPPTQGDSLQPFEFPLWPGQEKAFVRVRLKRMATVTGRVLGPDGQAVEDAVVGLVVTRDAYGGQRWSTTGTDSDGRFVLRTGRLHQREEIHACSSRYGLGRAVVEGLEEGDRRDDVNIQLSGAARVSGVVRDPTGAPLEGIWVGRDISSGESHTTDADGRFDLGQLPFHIPPRKGDTITFRAPRPHRGDLHMWRHDGDRQPSRQPDSQARFFHHKRVPLEAEHGEDVNLDVVLEAADLITFTGTVSDSEGKPVPNAAVMLFAGNAGVKSWQRELHPDVMSDGFAVVRDTPLCLTVTDEKGRWTVWVVRESEEDLKIGHYWTSGDAACYSIGAESQEGQAALVREIVLDEGQTNKQIDITLGEAPPGATISGWVVDADGKALPGIVLRTNRSVESVTSGQDGRFVFSFPHRAANEVNIMIQTKGWFVSSPSPGEGKRWFQLARGQDDLRNVEVVLVSGGIATGTVKWESGDPVTSFEVRSHGTPRYFTNAEGTFRIDDLPPGQQSLSVRTPEGVFQRVEVTVEPERTTGVEVVLPVPDCTIYGRVTDATGGLLPTVTVEVTGGAYRREQVPGENGHFRFSVPPGLYRLTPRGRGGQRLGLFGPSTVEVGGDEKEAEFPVVVPPAAETKPPVR